MSFPAVASVANGGDGANTMSHTITNPSGISSGDLLIAMVSMDGNTTLTWPAAGEIFTALSGPTNSGGDGTLEVRYRIADGSEGASFTITTSASERCSFVVYRITGWHGTTPPEAGTPATGSSTTPDPPTVSPSWGSDDNLFIVAMGWGSSINNISAYPSSYTDNQNTDSVASANQAGIATATRNLASNTDNPGTATIGSDNWVAMTMVVRPAAAGGRTTKNTDPRPLGVFAGISRRVANTP